MTRMIERWFPCAEVSAAAAGGWGSGNVERKLFTWFAARPTAQAKAAMICSLLPWPDSEPERVRLQELVRTAMTGREEAWDALRAEIQPGNDRPVRVLDPFSGRGMIPLEAARLGLAADAVDYSPVAVLASELLTAYPFQDWTSEPALPFRSVPDPSLGTSRLIDDVVNLLAEIETRHRKVMDKFYPKNSDGTYPWGYLWAVTLPCQECGRRFPLIGKCVLREPGRRKLKGEHQDPGQSFRIAVDKETGRFWAEIEDGPPSATPSLINALDSAGRKIPGKSAVCPFCSHVHAVEVHRRLTNEGAGRDALLVVGVHDSTLGKAYRQPSDAESRAANAAREALALEPPFSPMMSALPDELIGPGNNNIIGPSIYGARTYGDFMCDRQSVFYVRLCRTIDELANELSGAGLSPEYVRALSGYAAANMVRMLRYSTRGAWLHSARDCIAGIFLNEGSLSFSYDFFEAGIGEGPGTWHGVQGSSVSTLRNLMPNRPGKAVRVQRGTATDLPFADEEFSAVVTDPPYDEMIAYADSSDIFFSWLRRALHTTWPEMAISAEPGGAQEKALEIIVKRSRGLSKSNYHEHRTREHYDSSIAQAFREMRRVVKPDGVVTIVFGHGDPEVWQRLLRSIEQAGLIMTASWPANTESGGRQGKANIQITLTMSCRLAPTNRPTGRKRAVEDEIREEIARRYPEWERWGLAPADMLMSAAGPAMEVVGRYSEVRDAKGDPVDIHTFLPLARAAVQTAMALQIEDRPLDAFDSRTRFALWWVRLYGRQPQAKSELRWQVLASSLDLEAVRDLVEGEKAVSFVRSSTFKARITPDSALIDVAFAMAAASEHGLDAMAEVFARSLTDAEDPLLWAAIQFLADRLPGSDPDSVAFHRVLRARAGIGSAADSAAEFVRVSQSQLDIQDRQMKLL